MAISDSQKIDYLWKKVGFAATKTDTNDNKLAANEAIPSPFIERGDLTWIQANLVPTVKPSSSSQIVEIYSEATGNAVECTADNTSTQHRTWKTGLSNWIPPQFGSTYLVVIHVADAGETNPETNGTRLFITGSGNNDEWFFDYESGVLNFIGNNLPNGINFSGKSIFISGARYIGTIGIENLDELSSVSNVSFSSGGVESFTMNSTTQTDVTTIETVVSSFNKNDFNFAKLIINVQDLTYGQYQSSEVLLVHDGTDVKLTEYAIVHSSTQPIVTFNANIATDNVEIKASAVSSNNTIKILRFLD